MKKPNSKAEHRLFLYQSMFKKDKSNPSRPRLSLSLEMEPMPVEESSGPAKDLDLSVDLDILDDFLIK
jgi:hypothetical protein